MMSRTFGDEIGHSCGIICIPGTSISLIKEVKVFDLNDKSAFFVVGSDGLFEMLNENIIGAECR